MLAFTASLVGNVATFTGDADSDTFRLDVSGGLYEHNRGGDPGFSSDFDFDSTVAGDQTLAYLPVNSVFVNSGDGTDFFDIVEGVNYNGGIDGGTGGDQLQYNRFVGPIAVNLGGDSVLRTSLSGAAVVPPVVSPASGTAVLTFVDATDTFDLNVDAFGIPLANLTGSSLRLGPAGSNGPSIVDLGDSSAWRALDNTIQRDISGLAFPAANIGALLSGNVYIELFTTDFPAGAIRGQLFVVAAPQTATGIGTVTNIVRVIGGAGNDVLVGDGEANVLSGGDGDDLLIGRGNSDTLSGNAGNDLLIGGTGSDQLVGSFDREFVAVSGNDLKRFSAASLGLVQTIPVTGLTGGETLVGIDIRPATGQLYGLTNQNRLYIINPRTGAAVIASTLSTPLNGTAFGIDFNPTVDRLRIVSDADQNLRVNVDTGATTVDGTIAYAANDASQGVNPSLSSAAYTNSFPGATATTLYAIDTALDKLVIQNPPNAGTLNTVGGLLGFDFNTLAGFDIQAGDNIAYALSEVGGVGGLYTINLTTGAATLVGAVLTGPASGLTILRDDDVMVWNNGDGSDDITDAGGRDRVEVNGSPVGNDQFTLNAVGSNLRFDRVNLGLFNLTIQGVETIDVAGGGGDDSLTSSDLTAVTALQRVNFDGGIGNDTVNIANRAAAETTTLGIGMSMIRGGTYGVDARRVENTFAFGGAGDTAQLLDSAGDDTFYGLPSYSAIVGAGFTSQATGYQNVFVNRSAGADVAAFYDSAGNDTFFGLPGYSALSGTGYFIQSTGFAVNSAQSSAGGTDSAVFYDAPGNDTYVGTPTQSYMVMGPVTNVATNFRTYAAQAGAGGSDTAIVNDSAGNDVIVATSTTSYLTSAASVNLVTGFQVTSFRGINGGNDVTTLFDSAMDDRLFVAGSTVDLFYNVSGMPPARQMQLVQMDSVNVIGSSGINQKRVAANNIALSIQGNWFDF